MNTGRVHLKAVLFTGGKMLDNGRLYRRQWIRTAFLIAVDALLINLSAFAAIILRVEFNSELAATLGFYHTMKVLSLIHI